MITKQTEYDRTEARPAVMPSGPLSARERSSLLNAWGSRFPVVLVLVSLLSAIVLPLIGQPRIDRLRVEINQGAEPARVRVAGIRLALALEAAARRGYLLTGDAELAANLQESRRQRLEEERLLSAHASYLAEIAPEVDTLIASLTVVDEHLDSLFARGLSPAAYIAGLQEQRQRFDAALAAAGRLETRIERAAQERRDAIARIERIIAILTVALVLLALVAAVLVARLGGGFRRLALRLEQHREALERVTESRARLIRGFTHDVKNPLGAADGYLALLEDDVLGDLTPRQRESVGRARHAIGEALDLIAQLLDIARAETGELELRRTAVDIVETARAIADTFAAQAEAKGLTLTTDLPSELPAIETDPTRVRQIVGNLVSNAVKYTPPSGHIVIRAGVRQWRGRRQTDRCIAIEVEDDGGGIPPDKIPLLFREFTRFDPKAAQGAGIGLAISRKIATALDGDILVESTPGVGSIFTLALPLTPVRDPQLA